MQLTIKNGCKKYGDKIILDHINLSFEKGHAYGLIGVNGSGKTVLLKALCGFVKLSSGQVLQDHIELRQKHNYINDAGIIIENTKFISHYTLVQNLKLVKDMCPNAKDINLDDWINLYELSAHKNTKYKNLSLGTKQKMALIQAFMHKPTILILDEPMNALDDKSVKITYEIIRKHKENGIVILTSHNAEDIMLLCDQIYKIQEGKIID